MLATSPETAETPDTGWSSAAQPPAVGAAGSVGLDRWRLLARACRELTEADRDAFLIAALSAVDADICPPRPRGRHDHLWPPTRRCSRSRRALMGSGPGGDSGALGSQL